MNHSDMKIRDAQIIELRKLNKSVSEIAEALGVTYGVVSYACKRYGYDGKRSDKKPDYTKMKHQEPDVAKARERIAATGFDYVSGYTDTDCHVMIRCRDCGCVFDASFVSIRKGLNIECPECREAERKEAERMRKIEQETRRIESMMQTYRKRIEADKAKAKEQAKRVHRCPICGKPAERTLCCSDDCTRKYVNRVKDQRRRAKITDALVDADIQLAEVYRRDNGICYLCGGLCDFSDCVTTANGSFLAGDKYPSIDHVVPLAAGGKHSWDNVRLAHRICNSIKSDSIAPIVEK